MPELPEVETVRRGLVALLDGRSVVSAQVLHPRPVRRHPAGPDDFAATLIGRRLRAPRRRGKFLWFPFADGDAMVAHLGMSGQFRDDHPEAPLPPNARVLIDLDNGRQLRFVDQRMFGGLWLSPGGADLPDEVRRIALDPFDSAFDAVTVARSMSHRKAGIKRLLLDQCVVSGIGNIYADEGLWEAGVHGLRPGTGLGPRVVARILESTAEVMRRALEVGGTSFDALYVDVEGAAGFFARELGAYGRQGLECRRCKATMVREALGGRSHTYCPRCQTRPRRHR